MHNRSIIETEFKFSDGDQPGTFEGYGSIFGNVDSHGDVVVKGAFRDTLRDWKNKGKLPKMLLQHGMGFSNSDLLPIGKWDHMEEDEKGLFVRGHLFGMQSETGQRVYEAMKAGELDQMSIGYKALDFSLGKKPSEPYRTLKKVDLWEVSVVTFASNQLASISSVKSEAGEMTIREMERALCNGTLPPLSRTEAKALVAGGFKTMKSERDAPDDGDELAEFIRRNINILKT
ncbi:MAG: HK97 family phage prohead protease [Martelella sp.]|uniref:HK97 family phage prohead protease n=1 Tax=unclassified Martelella TaxID=2629616 RepID=UPI000C3A7347|nr:HK97 family phage prohead protease [Martelella sp.]MAU22552.1 HK97 family phage prohead protease [Martelella sp.]|tara:strand:+ start:457 stop:1149 length:693 start_codon:yes stop_codon:yes gene_type:complete